MTPELFVAISLQVSMSAAMRPACATAIVSECAPFAGKYRSVDTKHSDLEIKVDVASNQLNLVYDMLGIPARTRDETYVMDAAEHQGDSQLTGDTYSAKCDVNAIQIKRVFAKFKGALRTSFTHVSPEVIVETATMDGVPDWRIELGRFTRVAPIGLNSSKQAEFCRRVDNSPSSKYLSCNEARARSGPRFAPECNAPQTRWLEPTTPRNGVGFQGRWFSAELKGYS